MEVSEQFVAQTYMKLFRSEIQDGCPEAILKIYFKTEVQSTGNLVGLIVVTCISEIHKLLRYEIQGGCHGRHLEKLTCPSSEPKGKLTRNLIGSIGVTCKSKRKLKQF